MIEYKKPRSIQEILKTNTILKCLGGSHAYGTNIETSDIDYRGIFICDAVNILIPFYNIGEATKENDEDNKYYELSKYLRLYIQCNPNIVELLNVDECHIINSHPIYHELRKHRIDLLCSNAAHTFTGYAVAQLKRIRGHNKWINNPKPVDAPRQIDYVTLIHNFTDKKIFKLNLLDYHKGYRLIPYDTNLFGLYEFDGYETFDSLYTLNTNYESELNLFTVNDERRIPLFILKYNKEEYNRSFDDWKSYWSWKKNRNVARSQLEEQFGYDTKHAMHCIRLLRMGIEILRDGEVNVKRHDAQELLDIRNGKYTYNEIIRIAEDYDKEINEKWYKCTRLPKYPNVNLAGRILFELQQKFWST